MNHTETQIAAWEKLTRCIPYLITNPYSNGRTAEETAHIMRTEYLGKNIVTKACNTMDDCRRKIKAEAFSHLRKDTDSLQAQLIASDPVLAKMQAEMEATPFYKRLAARK
jgi:hypothetical protein